MRYRKLDSASGDMMFGSGQGDFWRDQPEAVAQSVLTRLMLWRGRWFADLTEGTPWQTEVLGERTQATRDVMLRSTVNDTPHVAAITQYASAFDRDRRDWAAALILDTDYGEALLQASRLPGTLPDLPPPPTPPSPPEQRQLGIIGSANFAIKRVETPA